MSLNKHLTKLQDEYFRLKSQATRAKSFSKDFHKRRKAKVKKEIIDNLKSDGFSEMEILFKMEEK